MTSEKQIIGTTKIWNRDVENFIDSLKIKYIAIECNDELKQKKFNCTLCDYSTDKSSTFSSHVETHAPNKDKKCRICNAKFNRRVLRVHINNFIKKPAKNGKHSLVDKAGHLKYLNEI